MEPKLNRNFRGAVIWGAAAILALLYVLFSLFVMPLLFVEFLGFSGVISFFSMLVSLRKEVSVSDKILSFDAKTKWWSKRIQLPIESIVSIENKNEYIRIRDRDGRSWELILMLDDQNRQTIVFEYLLKVKKFNTKSVPRAHPKPDNPSSLH